MRAPPLDDRRWELTPAPIMWLDQHSREECPPDDEDDLAGGDEPEEARA